MAKKSLTEKAQRMLQFLLALKNKAIAQYLMRYGFTQQTLDEGWALFQAVVGTTFDGTAPQPPDPKDLALLDDWENRWYPIAFATLEAHFPAVQARVFLNLSQTEGPQLVPNITTLLERICALEADGATDEDKAARALLNKRGLTHESIEEAQTILARLQTLELAGEDHEDHEDDEEPEQAAEDQANEDAMWTFYKEWSAISRAVIKSRKHLKLLGFLTNKDAPKSAPPAQPPADSAAPPANAINPVN